MSTRPETERCYSIAALVKKLGNEDRVGRNQVWVAKNYSLKDLIEDLKEIDAMDDGSFWMRAYDLRTGEYGD